ncbi:diguanylate cyclase [Falsiroseomonas sp. CW058]|uniref:GGDEF domain-containing protein n=1 Tax=Falsiroseomonas sp. CW058 TaxID=3388664 RepID=UPI003D3165B6
MQLRPATRRAQAALLGLALALVTAFGATSAVLSYHYVVDAQRDAVRLEAEHDGAQTLLLLLADSQAAQRSWILSGRQDDRDAARRARDALETTGRELAGGLEEPLLSARLSPLGAALEHLLRVQGQVAATYEDLGLSAATELARQHGDAAAEARIRGTLDEFRRLRRAEIVAREHDLRQGQLVGLGLISASAAAMMSMMLVVLVLLWRQHAAAVSARQDMDRRGRQVGTLFSMGELLQSSLSPEDVKRVVAHTAQDLLPDLGGAFYVFNNSRDRLDLMGAWGGGGAPAPAMPDHFAPNDCWALKRGRPHGCGTGIGLRCDHAAEGGACCLCVPMQARGEVYGVLQFLPPQGHAGTMGEKGELAQALADGVSLSLANLALREKLRNQALRDELTGLYNRRFLEETLPRMVAHAERRKAPIAVLMLDLDHFKQVNDRYGHAMGDAVLREVGAMLLARLRRMDIACRYGGEELMVLMPDCGAADALLRAQEICAMVRALHERADSALPPVTVSIGVAAWPEHGDQVARVVEVADAALYEAKRAGRDRAVPGLAAAQPAPLKVAAE